MGNQTPETRLKNEILLDCGNRNWVGFHINVGSVQMPDGTWFTTGVPKGWPDLLILTDTGLTIYIETKIKPRKPTKNQRDMLNMLWKKHQKVALIYSFDEWLDYLVQQVL